MSNTLEKLIFEHADVRAEFVQIDEAWQQIRANHQYPSPVLSLLGEMVAASTLLSANIKFNGAMVLQIQGDGPVRLLVVECDDKMHIRATAKLRDGADIAANATMQELINANGNGRFVITLDPHDKVPGQRPYQGIVSLQGENMSRIIENYMMHSEQLDTRIWLAANETVAKGVLLQKLPAATGENGLSEQQSPETWLHLTTLADTLNRAEMLEQDIDVLRHRLFWQEDMRLLATLNPSFQCTCSHEKVANMLRMLGRKEVEAALEEQGQLTVNCDFCAHRYDFSADECRALFDDTPPKATLH